MDALWRAAHMTSCCPPAACTRSCTSCSSARKIGSRGRRWRLSHNRRIVRQSDARRAEPKGHGLGFKNSGERKNSNMKIVVIGGTGLIGSKLVQKLGEHGHDVVAAAPSSGVNSLTGEGLADALKGASVVVDVTNAPSWEDSAVLKFFDTSTRNLLAYGADAGVRHHVALSVVGTERM